MEDRKKICSVCGWIIPEDDPYALCMGCVFGELLTDPASNALVANEILTTGVDSKGSPIQTYRLIRELGRGGMGLVWEAEQLVPLKRIVAFKRIKGGWNAARSLSRFEAERQRLAALQHQNIAKIFDAGSLVDGRPFFTMELVQGRPITEFANLGKLSIRQRIELFIPVCKAIQHAHQKGIVHRDIKPQNVLVSDNSGEYVPKVIDFGISKFVGPEIEQELRDGESALAGTLEYMAPEQFKSNGRESDTRTDVYGLGALFYEILVGTPPFGRRATGVADGVSIRFQIETQQPVPPSRLAANPKLAACRSTSPKRLAREISGDLDLIVLKAVAKDPSDRYSGADGLAKDLRSVLEHRPIEARIHGAAWHGVLKLARRQLRLIVVTLLLFATTSLGIWGFLWQDGKVKEERRRNRHVNAQLELQRAALHLAAGETSLGFGELGNVLRVHPFHPLATKQLAAALKLTSYTLPIGIESNSGPAAGHLGTNAPAERANWSMEGKTLKWIDGDGSFKRLQLSAHPSEVVSVDISPSGKLIATGCRDGSVRLWKATNSLPLCAPLIHDAAILRVHFESEFRVMCLDSRGKTYTWSIVSDERSYRRILAGNDVRALRWTGSNHLCLVLHSDGSGRVWNVESKAPFTERLDNLYDPRGVLGITADYSFIFSVDSEGALRLTNIQEGSPSRQRRASSPLSAWALSITRSNYTASAAGGGGCVYVRFASDPHKLLTLNGEIPFSELGLGRPPTRDRFLAIRPSPDGRFLLGIMDRGSCTLFDLTQDPTKNLLYNLFAGLTPRFGPSQLAAADFSLDSKFAVLCSFGGNFIVDLETKEIKWLEQGFRVNQGTELLQLLDVMLVGFLNDSRRFVSVSKHGYATIHNTETGASERLPCPVGKIRYASISQNRKQLTLANDQGHLLVVDLTTLNTVFSVHLQSPALSASWVIDEEGWLITLEESGLMSMWDGACTETARRSVMMGSVDGDSTIQGPVAIRIDGNVARLQRPNGAPSGSLYVSHLESITDYAQSSDGSLLLTCSADKTSRIWDTETGLPIGIPMLHDGPVRRGWFVGNRREVVTSSDDGFLYFWDTGLSIQGTQEGLPIMADAVAGLRVESDGTTSSIRPEDRLKALKSLNADYPKFFDQWIGEPSLDLPQK